MKLVLHLVAKDFMMLRGRLLVWWLVLAAKYALGFYLVIAADVQGFDLAAWQGGLMSFVGLDLALTLLLAGLLIQSDSPTAPAPFWATRPISRMKLFAAKIAAATVLLVVPPALLGVPWWWWVGFKFGHGALAGLEIAVVHGVVVGLALVMGTLTRSLIQFLVWSVVTVAVFLVAPGLTALVVGRAPPVAIVLAVLVGGLVVLAPAALLAAFTTRSRGRAAAVFAGGYIGVAILAGKLGTAPLSGLGRMLEQRESNVAIARDVQVEWRAATTYKTRRTLPEPDGLQIAYDVSGVPAGHLIGSGAAWHTWEWPVDPALRLGSALSGMSRMAAANNLLVAQSTAVEGALESGALTVRTFVHFTQEGASALSRLRSHPGHYRAQLRLTLLRPQVLTELSPAERRWRARGGAGLRILSVAENGRDKKVQVLESRPFALTRELWSAVREPLGGRADPLYVMRNTQTGATESVGGHASPSLVLGGVQLHTRVLDFAHVTGTAGGLADTRIAVVAFPVVSVFTRDVQAATFELTK